MEEIKDKDYSLEAVPESARKGFRSMFFVMLGFTFFSASMSVGAKLGNGLDFSQICFSVYHWWNYFIHLLWDISLYRI